MVESAVRFKFSQLWGKERLESETYEQRTQEEDWGGGARNATNKMCIINDHGGQLVLSPPLRSSQSPPPVRQGAWGVWTSLQSFVCEINAFIVGTKRLHRLDVGSLRSRSGVKDWNTVIDMGQQRTERDLMQGMVSACTVHFLALPVCNLTR